MNSAATQNTLSVFNDHIKILNVLLVTQRTKQGIENFESLIASASQYVPTVQVSLPFNPAHVLT